MSDRWFTHASPTLFNAGTTRPQLSSCFLICMKEDSIEGIYDTLKTCANISKSAGGIGLAIHNIRASGSYIAGVRPGIGRGDGGVGPGLWERALRGGRGGGASVVGGGGPQG